MAIGLCMGLAVLITCYSISRIGTSAMEAIARQPESADKVRDAMVLPCALIEGIGLISTVLCFVLLYLK